MKVGTKAIRCSYNMHVGGVAIAFVYFLLADACSEKT